MLRHSRDVRLMIRGGYHHYPPDDATALETRLPADDVSFPPPIGLPHIDGKVERSDEKKLAKRSAQTTEGNPWGLWTDDNEHKSHGEGNPWGPWSGDKQ